MFLRRKKPSRFWPSVGWLLFAWFLYWIAKMFLKGVTKASDKEMERIFGQDKHSDD